jgi:hypothetical protein
MMVVMAVMAIALHLIQTIKEAAARCQIFCLPAALGAAENGACEQERDWRL